MRLLETRIGDKYRLPNAENKIAELLEFEKNNNELVQQLKLKEVI